MATNTAPMARRSFMPQQNKPQTLEAIIEKVKALRSLSKETGFHTTRSIGQLLGNLSPDDLVQVSEALGLTPRELPR
jgi:predicted RNA polymerase sigma factor